MEGEPRNLESQKEIHPEIEHAEEVFTGGWRLTKGRSLLDTPESWVIYDGQGLLVIDPGGEMTLESLADVASSKPIGSALGLSTRGHKVPALRELEEYYRVPVKGILLTHGDADHTNNIESISEPDVPIYVDRHEWWSTLSPEKQFAASNVNMGKSPFTGAKPDKTDVGGRTIYSHDGKREIFLPFRDAGLEIFAATSNNPRGGSDRHDRKAKLAKRFHEFPESFTIQAGTLEAVPLPGHAPGEHGFYIPEQKVFIGGDLVTTSKQGQADRINIFLLEANVYDAVKSLKKIQSMDIESFYPAHGPPLIGRENIHIHLQKLIDDAEQIISRVQELAGEGPRPDAFDITGKVFTGGMKRGGMVKQSQLSWVISVLRDAPAPQETNVATN